MLLTKVNLNLHLALELHRINGVGNATKTIAIEFQNMPFQPHLTESEVRQSGRKQTSAVGTPAIGYCIAVAPCRALGFRLGRNQSGAELWNQRWSRSR